MAKWLRYLLFSIALIFIMCAFMMIGEEVFHLDFDNMSRLADKIYFDIFIVMMFVWIGINIALVVSVVKTLIARSASKYTPPELPAGNENRRLKIIDRRRLYDSDHVMQFGAQSTPMSWPYVALFLLIMCPIGVFLLIRKVIEEKSRYYENGISMIMLGSVATCFSLPSLLAFFTQETFEKISLFFLVPAFLGLSMIVSGLVFRNKGKTRDDYMIVLKLDQITRLDAIAQIMKTDYVHAADVIQGLIDDESLKGAYIYHKDREVIMPGISEKIAVRCRSCGATTVLYSTDKHECAYCGEVL